MAETDGGRGIRTEFGRLSTRATLPRVEEDLGEIVREAIACGVAWGREHPDGPAIPDEPLALPRELALVAEALADRWEEQMRSDESGRFLGDDD